MSFRMSKFNRLAPYVFLILFAVLLSLAVYDLFTRNVFEVRIVVELAIGIIGALVGVSSAVFQTRLAERELRLKEQEAKREEDMERDRKLVSKLIVKGALMAWMAGGLDYQDAAEGVDVVFLGKVLDGFDRGLMNDYPPIAELKASVGRELSSRISMPDDFKRIGEKVRSLVEDLEKSTNLPK